MDHHPVADINAHMGRSAGVVGFLEEDQVSGLCLTFRDNVAFSHQTIGRLSAYIPAIAAVVDDPADKAGTIKARARRAAAPDIGITEIFLCFGNHLSEFFIRQSLARNVVILVFSAGTCAIRRCKGDACKQVIPIAPALQCDFVALQLVICEAGISGNIVHTPIEQRYIEDFILILYRHLIGVGVSGSGDRIIAIAYTGFFPCPDFYLSSNFSSYCASKILWSRACTWLLV